MGIAVDVSARTENNGNVSLKERVAEYEHAMNEKSEGELEISGAVSANEGEREKLAEMGAQTEKSEHEEELKEESAFGAELVRLGAVDVFPRTENKLAEISMGAQTDELDVDAFIMARLRRRLKAKSDDADALSAECKTLRAVMKRLLKKNEAQHRLVKFYQNSLRSRQNRLSEAESAIERYREKIAGMDAHIETLRKSAQKQRIAFNLLQSDNFAMSKFLLMNNEQQQQHIAALPMPYHLTTAQSIFAPTVQNAMPWLAQSQPSEEQNISAVAENANEMNWPIKDEMANGTRPQRARVDNEQMSFVDGAESVVEPNLPIGANQNSDMAQPQPQPIEANENCKTVNLPAPTTNREMFRRIFDEQSNDAFATKSPMKRSRNPFA